ncbi:MAG: peptidoglycan-binding domain-containing protein [Bacteroidales bacterium]|nr:peptidoglycan-binding domain-containing protein [Bacteroidales bacterium]
MKKLLTIVLIASFAFVGAFGANAVTIEELQAQIATLLQQISALQGTTTPTTPSTAVCFTTDLQLGMTSSDVTSLQTVLAKDPAIYPEGLTTGYFGPLTLAAVKKYQAANNIITTGYVGPLTRGALNAQYCVTTPVTTPTTAPTATTTPVDATEGTLSATASPTFVETTIKKGDTQVPVVAAKLEAKNSNINVKRVDFNIFGTSIQP